MENKIAEGLLSACLLVEEFISEHQEWWFTDTDSESTEHTILETLRNAIETATAADPDPAAGNTVTIFEDPITRKVPEGRAVLVKKIWGIEDGKREYWRVRFVSDGFICDRFI